MGGGKVGGEWLPDRIMGDNADFSMSGHWYSPNERSYGVCPVLIISSQFFKLYISHFVNKIINLSRDYLDTLNEAREMTVPWLDLGSSEISLLHINYENEELCLLLTIPPARHCAWDFTPRILVVHGSVHNLSRPCFLALWGVRSSLISVGFAKKKFCKTIKNETNFSFKFLSYFEK